MAFVAINDLDFINKGALVKLRKEIRTNRGTFTQGHEFVVIGRNNRSMHLQDSERLMLEVFDFEDAIERA